MTDKEIARRLEKLERDNRRLKRVAFAGMALAAALVVIYSVACSSGGIKPGAEKVTAREFDMVDSAGKVRVKIAMDCSQAANCRPEIRLFGVATGSGEQEEASLLGDRLQFSVSSKGSAPGITAEVGSGSGGGGLLSLEGAGGSYVRANANSPSIEMKDAQGYVMDLGSVDLTTVLSGESSQTTADSIVMFGNDSKHHMIWRAP
ncbi:MAG TPA: hypothetical protein VF730_05720 [Terracidiphilus sp.]|nr:hypothetical protein [Terriglobia bacterium]